MKERIEQFQAVELWYEPRRSLQSKYDLVCEMSDDDHAFMCGLIKELRPKKIVEIGVAEGGTTAVIMETLSLLNMKSEVYSVDLNEALYYDREKETGYVWKALSDYIAGESTQEFKLGTTIAGTINEIGDAIDLAIIDTTHSLPGEILDFLCILPYLEKHATVLLHDTSQNWFRCFSDSARRVLGAKDAVATKILYAVVTAKKRFCFDDKPRFNIAAFTINEDTVKYIGDCFQVLSLTWGHMLSESLLSEYRNIFSIHYNKQCMELFDIAVRVNRDMRRAIISKKCAMFVEMKKDELKREKDVIVYGGGVAAVEIVGILQKENINISAVVTSSREGAQKKVCGIDVKPIDSLSGYQSKKLIIASIIDEYIKEMEQNAIRLGYKDILKIDKGILMI